MMRQEHASIGTWAVAAARAIVMAQPVQADPIIIGFDAWPNGDPIAAPPGAPFLSITDEFAAWGIIFEPTTQIHQHGTPAHAPSPPNCLFPDVDDGVTVDATFVDPLNPLIAATVPWVEITQDGGASSGGNTIHAYDINGNLVDSISFNESFLTVRLEWADGIHRILANGHDSLDDLTFPVIPAPGALAIIALGALAARNRRR